jgi:hypothetical protein
MRFGSFVFGEFKGIRPDEGYGTQLRVRTGEPTVRSPDGYEERIDYTPYDAQTGLAVLPEDLRVGDFVAVRVRVTTKGYVSDKKGLGGMSILTLQGIEVLSHGGDPVSLWGDVDHV